jgi:hypothetical protein
MLEDEFIPANIFLFFEKQLPRHGVDVDDVGDVRLVELQEDEGAWHARVRACVEWNHLERDVRELRYFHEVPELCSHGFRAAKLTPQRSFVDDAPQVERAVVVQQRLSLHPHFDPALNFVAARVGEAATETARA